MVGACELVFVDPGEGPALGHNAFWELGAGDVMNQVDDPIVDGGFSAFLTCLSS